MTGRVAAVLVILLLGGALAAAPALAFDPNQTFAPGTWIGSLEGGFGNQENVEGHTFQTDLDLWYGGARLSYVPFGTSGTGFFYGAFDVGLEGLYVGYTDPVEASWAGLGLVGRYNFLSLGRFVPFVELGAYAGGTDLEVREIDSDFAFLLEGSVGASFFVTDTVALYAGYRLVHVSNGNTDTPNRGFEAHTGLAGVSFHFK